MCTSIWSRVDIFRTHSFLSPAEKEKNGFELPRKERRLCKPGVQTVPPSCDNSLNWLYLPALTHLSAGNYAPHAILMMAVISLPTNTVKAKTSIRRKSRARLWSMESPENHPKGSLVVSFLFFTGRGGSFLSPKRERKEWGRKNIFKNQWTVFSVNIVSYFVSPEK